MSIVLVSIILLGGWICRRQHLQNAQRRTHIAQLEASIIDPVTGLLSESALAVRLIPELSWARELRARMGLIVIRPYGSPSARTDASTSMRQIMRGYENAFRYGDRDVLIALWDVDHHGAVVAAGRLVEALSEGGCRSADVGIALYPDDGHEVEELVATARSRVCPAQQVLAYAADWRGRDAPAHPPMPRSARAA